MQDDPLRFSVIAVALIIICESVTAQRFFSDTRDNSKYEVFEIGDKLWFKENLKFKTPTNILSPTLVPMGIIITRLISLMLARLAGA
jgi:hypothetical protein